MKEVRILASSPAIDLTVPMSGPANLTGGLGGWHTLERVDDIDATDWSGQAPLQQELPLLLDGYSEGRSVETELRQLLKLGRDVDGDENVPPIIRVFGPIYFSGDTNPKLRWVLGENGIELDSESQIRKGDGTLVRQALTLNLLEYVKPGEIRLRGKRKKQGKVANATVVSPPRSYVTKQGDTLQSIAKEFYGDWKMWDEIGKLNGLQDPNRKLPPKTKLKLPR